MARCLTPGVTNPDVNFSLPANGRFTLLISPRPEFTVGQELEFEVCAFGPNADRLCLTFQALVTEPVERPAKEPQRIDSDIPSGSVRRPPYRLIYINRDDYDSDTCWGNVTWTDEDPGCFQEPTERAPLTLIINQDMEALRYYRQYITKTYMESEVTRRMNKYTSHIAFHLYQMFTESKHKPGSEANEGPIIDIDQVSRQEIHRVAMTLLKLMEVSR